MGNLEITYRNAFCFVLLVQLLFFLSYPLGGNVIFSNDNALESGVHGLTGRERIEKKGYDLTTFIVPALEQQLNSNSSAWLATWDPHPEFGRIILHVKAVTRAFLITNALSMFTDNPFVLYTLLTVTTVMLMGIFMFMFLREIGLHPLACAISAVGFSLGNMTIGYLIQISFISTLCWTICLLWLVTKFIDKRTPAVCVGISFAVYSLFMSGFLQYMIVNAYLIVGYTIIRTFFKHIPAKQKAVTIFYLVVLAVVGIAAASPAYIDLAFMSFESLRTNMTDAFTISKYKNSVHIELSNIPTAILSLLLVFDRYLFGDPWLPGSLANALKVNLYPYSPMFFCLFLFSFAGYRTRKIWPWFAFMSFFSLIKLYAPAYEFAVHHLGFNISVVHPFYFILIPIQVLSAYAIDDILCKKINGRLFPALVLSFMLVLFISSMISIRQLGIQALLDTVHVIVAILITVGTMLFAVYRKPVLLIALAVVSVYMYGYGMRIAYPLKAIRLSSPLLERVKQHTEGGYRFIKVGIWGYMDFLPVNQESLYGLKSVHTYDSLSPKKYLYLAQSIGLVDPTGLGRYVNHAPSDNSLKGIDLSYTGVELLLSRESLDSRHFRLVDRDSGINFYQPRRKPILESQIEKFTRVKNNVFIKGYLQEQSGHKVEREANFDDHITFKVTPVPETTLLFVSQQYNTFWKASSGEKQLDTVQVRRFYQGVIIPPGTENVTLRFEPYVLWSWIPQVWFSASGVSLLLLYLKRRKRKC
jgi:hypothetical protein